ncbi:MAG TPA: RNase adapter RapZ [Burkholderiales bacterium]
MNLVIVSGLSGSGKTLALQALEDSGYYCIDNVPAALLPEIAEHLRRAREQNVAVGLDARNRAFLAAVPEALARLEALGVRYRIVFLHADEPALVKRYKETRRRHPMAGADTSLVEAIARERALLEPLADAATLRIDTSSTTPHDLRSQVRDFVRGGETAGITLLFQSFGYKNGTPLDADFVFDVRCLPNPHWEPSLRHLSGHEAAVVEYMERHDEVHAMYEDLKRFLEAWLPRFEREDRSYVTVAIGCTGGMHRSVYLVNRLARHFAGRGYKTQVRHRELR